MIYEGSASLVSNSSFNVEGSIDGSYSIIASETIVSTSNITANGTFISVQERVDAVRSRTLALKYTFQQDFLNQEDIQPLFNNREVIFDV